MNTTKVALRWDCPKCDHQGFHGPRYCPDRDRLTYYCVQCGYERFEPTTEQQRRNKAAREEVTGELAEAAEDGGGRGADSGEAVGGSGASYPGDESDGKADEEPGFS